MVQGATLHYSQQVPNAHFSNYMMGGYPQQPQQLYQQNWNTASRSVPQMQYTTQQSQQQPTESQLYSRRAQAHQQQHQQQQQQTGWSQQQHQQQQQLVPTSAAPSLPPLSQLFSGSSQNSQQTQQASQQPQSTQMQQQADPSAAMSVSQAQNLQAAYQQNAQYTDVNAPYVTLALADGSAYVAQSTQPMSMQAQLTAQSLPPILPTSNAVEIVAAQLPMSTSSSTSHQRSMSNSQAQAMLAINTAMLPTSESSSTTSPVSMSPLQNGSNSFQYPQYSALHHSLMSSPATVNYGAPVSNAANMSGLGHRRTISASSATSATSMASTRDDDDSSSSSGEHSQHHKVFSFVSLPGVNTKKRPRRKFDEIERHYQCNWQGCTKSYGTLNHLNAHVSMQKHGQKRIPSEFKELRKQWRRQKREEAAKRAAEEARESSHASTPNKMEDDE
ncbi:hypothetical protein BC938DRAFT_472080 [Jimgerdemannia flammicorona]|uniref:C2H2-type domain-containing protein n=1 Tax=Jimgerdemannia flammicorona TaxID=994334 RepID=A0A433Q6W4_9FUNG|nr:hypothetical protein BC938DRAFT_472080 [Jimgerdemannia flammicorona]